MSADEIPSEAELICFECDREIEIEADFCPHCGASLEPENVADASFGVRVPAFLRKQGRQMIRNPLGFFIRWGIYIFFFALGVSIFRGCLEGAISTIAGA